MGAATDAYESGERLLKALQRESYDMLLMDWNLPGIHGPEIVKSVRALLGHHIPIVFITNRSLEEDIVAGLQAGADDYVAKPVRPAELAARIQALLRRAYPSDKPERQEFGPYAFDLVTRTALLDGEPMELQPREFDLAVFLFNNAGRLLSRAHLIESALHTAAGPVSRSLDTHISRLRSKLRIGPSTGYRLSSVYGVGYRLDEMGA